MKTPLLPLLTASLFLASCLSPQQQATFSNNAMQVANAALLGGLNTGTWAGAAAGATAQEIENIRARQRTAAKNPGAPVNPK